MPRKKISMQSLSFFVLFLIALLGTYGALLYSQRNVSITKTQPENTSLVGLYEPAMTPVSETDLSAPAPAPVDVSGWKSYDDPRYHFTFKYPANWKIANGFINKDGYYELAIRTDKKGQEAKIYLSRAGYLGLEGLPSQKEPLAGQEAQNVQDQLYGIKWGKYFYTFDLNTALDYKAEFKKLVDTMTFPAGQ